MDLPKFDEFKRNPSIETAMEFGSAITQLDAPVEHKRMIFQKAFEISEIDMVIDAVINMWATATMIEDDLPIPQKVLAVRGFLDSSEITAELVEQWVKIVYRVNRAPSEDEPNQIFHEVD
jgi:predicted methyltransferase MtxX (methanogen marker protein 4)